MAARPPVDPGADFAAVVDGLDSLTVEQIDPDTGGVLATCEGVTAVQNAPRVVTDGAGGGEVGSRNCSFTLLASDMTFEPRSRDRVTDADGVRWSIGDVTVGGFGTLYRCANCVKLRG